MHVYRASFVLAVADEMHLSPYLTQNFPSSQFCSSNLKALEQKLLTDELHMRMHIPRALLLIPGAGTIGH